MLWFTVWPSRRIFLLSHAIWPSRPATSPARVTRLRRNFHTKFWLLCTTEWLHLNDLHIVLANDVFGTACMAPHHLLHMGAFYSISVRFVGGGWGGLTPHWWRKIFVWGSASTPPVPIQHHSLLITCAVSAFSISLWQRLYPAIEICE